jgi:formamidopyrimidine-DNA glycosylase
VPELPEVEFAARVARVAAVGRTIAAVHVLHPAALRSLSAIDAASIAGEIVSAVHRRGKHQLIALTSGRTLHVHFRMTGDWETGVASDPLPRHARVALEFTDGTRLALSDPRALAVVTLHPADHDPLPDLGPEANDERFDGAWLRAVLAGRRGPIKPVLLDQRVVAGIGNIYAAEALWHARVDPRRPANRLSSERLTRVVAGVQRVMQKAFRLAERYYGTAGPSDAIRFDVYDREGKPCRRCGSTIRRIVQAGRSTYYCGKCQR